MEVLRTTSQQMSINELSHRTAIRVDDIIDTLQSMRLIKYWKGQHIICVTPKVLEEHMQV